MVPARTYDFTVSGVGFYLRKAVRLVYDLYTYLHVSGFNISSFSTVKTLNPTGIGEEGDSSVSGKPGKIEL